MARLKILSADDFDNLYTIPKIEKQDREFLFELDEYDNKYLNTLTVSWTTYYKWSISVYLNTFLILPYME